MIPANKNKVSERVFARINRRMLRRHFHAVHCAGMEHVQQLDRSRPIILFGNHSCWWDGLLEFFFSHEVFGFDAFLMMEEKQMARYKFFRWIGAFSVNRDSPRDGVASLQYAASLFDRPNRVLWIYPQGVMRPNDYRPLGFYRGVSRLPGMLGGAQVVPVAHRYEFLMQQRPEAFTLFGTPLDCGGSEDAKQLAERLETLLTELLDGLRSALISGTTAGFSVVLRGKSSTNIVYDRARGKHGSV